MAISNEELYRMVKNLPEGAKKSAYGYLRYLSLSVLVQIGSKSWRGNLRKSP
jgi:hypothetical protein